MYSITIPSLTTEFNAFSPVMIHHKQDKFSLVLCPDHLATGDTGLKDILRYRLVKVYVVHISIIPFSAGIVKKT